MSRVSPAALAAAKKVLTTEGRIAPLNDETLAEVLEAALAVHTAEQASAGGIGEFFGACRPESEAVPVLETPITQPMLDAVTPAADAFAGAGDDAFTGRGAVVLAEDLSAGPAIGDEPIT